MSWTKKCWTHDDLDIQHQSKDLYVDDSAVSVPCVAVQSVPCYRQYFDCEKIG